MTRRTDTNLGRSTDRRSSLRRRPWSSAVGAGTVTGMTAGTAIGMQVGTTAIITVGRDRTPRARSLVRKKDSDEHAGGALTPACFLRLRSFCCFYTSEISRPLVAGEERGRGDRR